MNHPNQLRHQRLLSSLVCISLLAAAGSSLFGQQVIRQTYPSYQQPLQYTPVYPSQAVPIVQPRYPIQNGSIIYGQPIPIQNGQIIDGQFSQPSVIFAPPSTQQAKPDAGNTAKVKQVEEVSRPEEVSRLEEIKRLEKIKRLITENKRLEALVLDNGKQTQEVQRLQSELRKAKLELSEMQKFATAKSADMNSATTEVSGKIQRQQEEIDRLSANYQSVVQRNEALTSQIKTLVDESSIVKAQVGKSGDGQTEQWVDLKQLQFNLATTSTAFKELKQKNEAMVSDYNRVQDVYESANAENVELNKLVGELSFENKHLARKLNKYANTKGTMAITDDGRVEDAPTSFTLSSLSTQHDLDSKTSFTVDQGLDASNLKRKNQQLLGLNEQANRKNELLNRRVSELEGTVNDLTINNADREATTTESGSSFDGALSDSSKRTDSSTGKYDIISWLIPFLSIGLSIGLYVFLTEEFQGAWPILATDGETQDDRA